MKQENKGEKLLVVGSIAFDSVTTPGGSVEMAMGGSASYASIAAGYWCRPLVVGVVGEDFGDRHFKYFEDHGVDTRGVEKVKGKTFHWRGRYHDDFKGRDTLETALNVFETFDPEIPAEYTSARYVFLGNIAPALQLKVLDQIPGADLVAMDTMNLWIDITRDELEAVVRRVDILFINDEEAVQFSGEGSIPGAAKKILTMGPKYLVVKRGECGALLFVEDECLSVPAVLLETVVDPTGAGDSFAGGFMGYLAGVDHVDRPTLAAALINGTVIASFTVQEFSVDGVCALSQSEIDTRRVQLERMIKF